MAPSEPNPRVLPLKTPEEANGDYRAFDIREHSTRMDIRCARGPSRFPSYQYLLDIIFDYEFSSAFTLIYTFMVVEVEGQNLEPVVHAIAHGSCERITEFHPRRHPRKPDEGEAFIERISVVAAAEQNGEG